MRGIHFPHFAPYEFALIAKLIAPSSHKFDYTRPVYDTQFSNTQLCAMIWRAAA